METIAKKPSFRCAFDQIPHGKVRQVKRELKEALGIKTDQGLYSKINGTRDTTLSQSWIIEEIFKKYGITVVWGCNEPEKEEV